MSRARTAGRVAAAGLAAAVVAVYCSDRLLLDRPDRWVEHYAQKLSRRLLERHGIVACWTFDEAEITEQISRTSCLNSYTRRVRGRHGWAREFQGEGGSFVGTGVPWRALGTNYTVALWLKLSPDREEQAILCTQEGDLRSGFVLHDGRMNFVVPCREGIRYAAYDFGKYGEFVHLAAVVDGNHGRLALYENGVEVGSAVLDAVQPFGAPMAFGRLRRDQVVLPLHATVDETAAWNRCLPAEEIRRLSAGSGPLIASVERGYYLKWRAAAWLRAAARRLLKCVDLFNPFVHQGRLAEGRLPERAFLLSNADLRHFNKARNETSFHGCLPRDGAGSRRVRMARGDAMPSCEMAVVAPDVGFRQGARSAFLVSHTNGSPVVERELFAPPEATGLLRPLLVNRLRAELGLPHIEPEPVLLRINGSLKGLFHVEPYACHTMVKWWSDDVFRHALQSLSLPRDRALAFYDDLAAAYGARLANDSSSPLSSREVRYMLRRDRGIVEQALADSPSDEQVVATAGSLLNEEAVLGSNPAAYYVLTDLPLPTGRFAEVDVAWTSTDPGLISAEGRVVRPEGDRPAAVSLRADLRRGAAVQSRELRFRVMPQEIRLPALMVRVPEAIGSETRVDALAEWREGGAASPGAALAGRIRLRGANALVQRKRSYSLKMDEPQPFLEPGGSRFVYLQGSYQDRSLIKNRFCYDLFRDLSGPEAPRHAPGVRFVELFLNGRYDGVYQMTAKVDRHLLGLPPYEPGQERPAVLYKARGPYCNFKTVDTSQYRQDEPPPETLVHWGPYENLMRFLGETPPEEFARHVAEWIDVDNAMDYQLFINAVGSRDAKNHNLYLARQAGPGSRFFIVPWDCDLTLGRYPDLWLTNDLFERLMRDLPGYTARLQARWRELRAGSCSDAAMQARLETLVAELDGYIQCDFERWPARDATPEQLFDGLRAWLPARLKLVDERIAGLSGGAHAAQE